MKKDYSALIFGILIIAIGIILSGNIFNIWHIDIFFDGWWTLFLIVPGIISILRRGFNWGSGIIVTIGLIFLLDSQDIVDSRIMWKLIFPIVLIAIGISIITSFFRRDKYHFEIEYSSDGESYESDTINDDDRSYKTDNSQHPRYSTILGGGEIKNNSDNLKSVTIEAILGGFDLDLRDAKINEDIDLDITVVLGGVDIYLPSNVEVVIVSGTPVLGGLSFRKNIAAPGAPKVRVKYVTVLGGVEIK